MARRKRKHGWVKEPSRHSLAAMGIASNLRNSGSRLSPIPSLNSLSGSKSEKIEALEKTLISEYRELNELADQILDAWAQADKMDDEGQMDAADDIRDAVVEVWDFESPGPNISSVLYSIRLRLQDAGKYVHSEADRRKILKLTEDYKEFVAKLEPKTKKLFYDIQVFSGKEMVPLFRSERQ